MALADAADPAHRVRGVELLDALGATARRTGCRVELRQEGVPNVPQRPRASTRANPAGLTNRQLDVAKLVARGLHQRRDRAPACSSRPRPPTTTSRRC